MHYRHVGEPGLNLRRAVQYSQGDPAWIPRACSAVPPVWYSPPTRDSQGRGSGQMRPQEVAAALLRHLLGAVEAATSAKVRKAVISVPAYFTEPQRQATIEAGKLAGLDTVRLLRSFLPPSFPLAPVFNLRCTCINYSHVLYVFSPRLLRPISLHSKNVTPMCRTFCVILQAPASYLPSTS